MSSSTDALGPFTGFLIFGMIQIPEDMLYHCPRYTNSPTSHLLKITQDFRYLTSTAQYIYLLHFNLNPRRSLALIMTFIVPVHYIEPNILDDYHVLRFLLLVFLLLLILLLSV